MVLTYQPEYSPPKTNKKKTKIKRSEMFTNTVLKGCEIHCCTRDQTSVHRDFGSYSIIERLKMGRAVRTVRKDDIRMDGMQVIFSKKRCTSHTISRQSAFNVNSKWATIWLKSPPPPQKKSPPLCYTSCFGNAREMVEEKGGKINNM